MPIKPAFVHELDAERVTPLRFSNPADRQRNRLSANRSARLALVVYGQLQLKPHQLFEHPIFYPGGELNALLRTDAVRINWHTEVSRKTPFTDVFAELLRSEVTDTPIWANVADPLGAAKEWTGIIEGNRLRSAVSIRKLAASFPPYRALAEWVAELDNMNIAVTKQPGRAPSFAELAGLLDGVAFPIPHPSRYPADRWPASRSGALQEMVHDTGGEPNLLGQRMGPYDVLSTLRFACLYDAIPVMSGAFHATTPHDVPIVHAQIADPDDLETNVALFDIGRLAQLWPAETALLEGMDIAHLLDEARNPSIDALVSRGWNSLRAGDASEGERILDDAVNRFFDNLRGEADASKQPSCVDLEGSTTVVGPVEVPSPWVRAAFLWIAGKLSRGVHGIVRVKRLDLVGT